MSAAQERKIQDQEVIIGQLENDIKRLRDESWKSDQWLQDMQFDKARQDQHRAQMSKPP
jgi:hypothetical protein